MVIPVALKNAFAALCIGVAAVALLRGDAVAVREQDGARAAAEAVISQARFRQAVVTLSSDRMEGRAVGTAGSRNASASISSTFSSIGLRPGYDGGFLQHYRHDYHGSAAASNVIGMLPGNDPEVGREAVLVVAHYDHLGRMRGDGCPDDPPGQCIMSGANDNATGVAALFELARAFATLGDGLKRTVLFIALDGEECGCTGSNHYVFRAPAHPIARTVYVLNIDQIGLGGGLESHATHGGGFGRNCDVDGEVFARAGIRAQTLVGGNRHYHQCTDKPDTVNYSSALNAVQHAFDILWSAVQGEPRQSGQSAPQNSSVAPSVEDIR
jgi:hypothetical protein